MYKLFILNPCDLVTSTRFLEAAHSNFYLQIAVCIISVPQLISLRRVVPVMGSSMLQNKTSTSILHVPSDLPQTADPKSLSLKVLGNCILVITYLSILLDSVSSTLTGYCINNNDPPAGSSAPRARPVN
jgi:hypothetical protein